ncbi:uncharacterized protein MAM_02417 [Metarhizium album ARSEF 1941]|uniref:Uncharacterized protein n=1 Tax=Metarhizium album (strain ARSEF 1941) TaxID=1081103 RepID=A0A0B2X108_METAS|nr:uncharacterized protein MAM_02417 [Metarhizium album ARSEF 1941]KHN99564.1 hypothetical protein MAM_02417 [Metarhizium album ARSEF 1941]
MASVSRGIALLPLPLRALPRPCPAAPSRLFTTSLLRLRTAQPGSLPPKQAKKTPYRPSPPAENRTAGAPSRYAFVKSLSSKQTPTVLYEAPSHFWFYFGCWSSGVAILSWTALTGPTVVQQPDGTPQWVGFVFGASYVLLGAMGFYLLSKTPNIVSTIRVLPPAPSPAGAASPRLEVTVKRMLPVLRPRTVTAGLESVALKSRFSLPEEYVPELARLEQRRREEQRREALRRFDMEHLLTMPFRRLGRTLANMFRGVRSAWTDMGFGVLRVDGKEFKVDVTKGFAHDGFRTLEQIVAVGYAAK